MSWQAVAEKDFRDAIRSRLILIIAVLFVLFTAGGAAIGYALGIGGGGVVGLITFLLLSGAGVLVPLIAIGVSYRTIAGERESGSLKILLSLPNSRADIVIGKFLGRSAVLTTAVLVGFFVSLLVQLINVGAQFPIAAFLGWMLTTLLLGFAYVSIAVAISAFTNSTFRAAIGGFGIFLFFAFLWRILLFLLWFAANGFERPGFGTSRPEWLDLLDYMNPGTSYDESTQWLLDRLTDTGDIAGQTPGLEPFGLAGWYGLIVLLFWIAMPLLLGYWRFERVDL